MKIAGYEMTTERNETLDGQELVIRVDQHSVKLNDDVGDELIKKIKSMLSNGKDHSAVLTGAVMSILRSNIDTTMPEEVLCLIADFLVISTTGFLGYSRKTPCCDHCSFCGGESDSNDFDDFDA